ncbi:hypothetical protein [[Mycoplasma] testudinis]|uniref:hypothetical protein n=1 Tax=[Mycoplasma] testudinis TaxID=33924 RepID=UPI00048A2C7D|nr:hypothetical protein [[Mycoplasma] testudinis]
MVNFLEIIRSKKPYDVDLQKILLDFANQFLKWKTLSQKTAFSKEYTMQAPFLLSNSYESIIIRNSFNYVARFLVTHKYNKNDASAISQTRARVGYEMLKRWSGFNFVDRQALIDVYTDATSFLTKLISHEIVLDEAHMMSLFRYCSFLGKLDYVSASLKSKIKNLNGYLTNDKYLKDLSNLTKVFQNNFLNSRFFKKTGITYNAEFGLGGSALFFVEGNMLCDGNLIEIFTSKNFQNKNLELMQIAGQYLANETTREAVRLFPKGFAPKMKALKQTMYDIRKLVLYHGRFGEIEYADVSKIPELELRKFTHKIIRWSKLRYELEALKDELVRDSLSNDSTQVPTKAPSKLN